MFRDRRFAQCVRLALSTGTGRPIPSDTWTSTVDDLWGEFLESGIGSDRAPFKGAACRPCPGLQDTDRCLQPSLESLDEQGPTSTEAEANLGFLHTSPTTLSHCRPTQEQQVGPTSSPFHGCLFNQTLPASVRQKVASHLGRRSCSSVAITTVPVRPVRPHQGRRGGRRAEAVVPATEKRDRPSTTLAGFCRLCHRRHRSPMLPTGHLSTLIPHGPVVSAGAPHLSFVTAHRPRKRSVPEDAGISLGMLVALPNGPLVP